MVVNSGPMLKSVLGVIHYSGDTLLPSLNNLSFTEYDVIPHRDQVGSLDKEDRTEGYRSPLGMYGFQVGGFDEDSKGSES